MANIETPDTTAQAAARKTYDDACRELADASVKLQSAQRFYDAALERYNIAFGAALFAKVITK